MSWSEYVEKLKATGVIDDAAILGMDLGVWATSDDLKIMTEEVEKLKKDNMVYFLGGKKYMKLREEEGLLHLKAVGSADGINRNVTVGRANKCMVVGVGSKEASGGAVSTAVGRIRDYLLSVQF